MSHRHERPALWDLPSLSSACWDVAIRTDLFLPTARPDSDGSKRAALRRTYRPLAWTECTYLSPVLVTAVATETASQACVSATWDTQVRPTMCLWQLACKSSLFFFLTKKNRSSVYHFLSKNSRTWPSSTWAARGSAVSSYLSFTPKDNVFIIQKQS